MSSVGFEEEEFSDRTVLIQIRASAFHPNLLAGLQSLWRLGLISNVEIQQIAREQLSCPLRPVVVARPELSSSPVLATPAAATVVEPRRRSPRWFQSFMDELSVLWLLFLGVFLVVVSSAVLAASQWQNVSVVGQYSILGLYTLVFWGAGLWAERQANLRLTAQMLQRVTLLLVPINFWAMDGFGLLSRAYFPLGWLVGGGAAIALSFVVWHLLQPRFHSTVPPHPALKLNLLLLSWLHWGWSWESIALWPLLATYLGMIGTAIAVLYRGDRLGLSSTTLVTLLGALLLLGRALLLAQVPLPQLGLAFGLCGAVLAWRSRATQTAGVWFTVGSSLMALGWAVSLRIDPPWQPVAVSLLALGILAERLRRLRLPFDLTAVFLVGLQGVWLVRRFLPLALRENLGERVAAIAGSGAMPYAVVGLTLFPYLLLFLWVSERFRQRNEPVLLRQANFLCLALGAGLTVFSLGNGLMRPLNLTLSAIALGWVMGRRGLERPVWPNLTQLLFWGSVLSWVGFFWLTFPVAGWLSITLAGALLEWALAWGLLRRLPGLDWRRRPQSWRRSAWQTGLGLGLLSWIFCVLQVAIAGSPSWGLLGWGVPVAIALLSTRSEDFVEPATVHKLGIATLVLAQAVTLPFPAYRLLGLGLATLLAGWHSRRLLRGWSAAIAVGFGVAFSFVLAFRGQPEQANLEQWLFVGSAIALVLWSFWSGLLGRSGQLKPLYAEATKGWAIALFIPVLILLTFGTLMLYLVYPSDPLGSIAWARFPSGWLLATAASTTLSMGLCTLRSQMLLPSSLPPASLSPLPKQNFAHPAFLYGLAITTELLVSLTVGIVGMELGATLETVTTLETVMTVLAIANLLLALLAQLRTRRLILPLGYAWLGAGLAHLPFDAWSGVFTIAAAMLSVRAARRSPGQRVVCFAALFGISLGSYELLVYQLSQASGGSPGDGLVMLGLLGAALALLNDRLGRWLVPAFGLGDSAFRRFTQVHWAIATLFSILALSPHPGNGPDSSGPLSPQGGLLWMLTLSLLGGYALLQDHASPPETQGAGSAWTDFGLVQLLSAMGYGIHLVFPWAWLLGWAAAIACPIAAGLHRFPWRRLGRSPAAGQRWAKLLPIILVILTAWDITTQSLLITATFYAGLAVLQTTPRAVRLSYLSVALVDWAMLRVFDQFGFTDPLWYAGLLGATVLYVAQLDPELRSQRDLRHRLRGLGSGIVCFAGLYQGQVGLGHLGAFWAGLLAIALSLAFVLTGMALRIRAFLFVGTAAFLLQVLLQVWQFIQDESLLLWAMGIVLGLLLIWVAATFEARRSQVIALIDRWVTALDDWQ